MRRIISIVTLCAGCWLAAGAQTTFTEQLQKSKAGEGKVTVTHDKSIDDLVNDGYQSAQTEKGGVQDKSRESQDGSKTQSSNTPNNSTTIIPDTVKADNQRKVLRGGHKVNGFRVQVFAGGNSRNDRIKAERIGNEMKSLFPAEPVYVHFYSPRWVCRIGNYRTYEEAHEMLNRVKNLNYRSAIIVKGKITVQ